MSLRSGVLASFRAGIKLRTNMDATAAKSHAAISAIMKAVTNGWRIRIITVMMVPNDKPNPQLERRIMTLCRTMMAATALDLAPMARRKPNS